MQLWHKHLQQKVTFSNVFTSSGAQGFWGEGYWFHRWLGPLKPNFQGAVFVSKTTTLMPRPGNMPLKPDGITPEAWMPKCIRVYPVKGLVLNSVGLSGPGLTFLLAQPAWKERTQPFWISIMSVTKGKTERLYEYSQMAQLFSDCELSDFKAPFGIQINAGCPNTGEDPVKLAQEILDTIEIFTDLPIPVMANFGPLGPIDAILAADRSPYCDVIGISNTMPWGKGEIDWPTLFKTAESPLADLGGGGLSGKPLLPIVIQLVKQVKSAGGSKPLIAGGGILSVRDIYDYHLAGADGISLGCAAILRPWRVQSLIRQGLRLFPN